MGHSYRRIRAYLHRRGIGAVIPRLHDEAYRCRNVVEGCVGWLKGERAVATRQHMLAASNLAFVKLAMLQRLLHVLR